MANVIQIKLITIPPTAIAARCLSGVHSVVQGNTLFKGRRNAREWDQSSAAKFRVDRYAQQPQPSSATCAGTATLPPLASTRGHNTAAAWPAMQNQAQQMQTRNHYGRDTARPSVPSALVAVLATTILAMAAAVAATVAATTAAVAAVTTATVAAMAAAPVAAAPVAAAAVCGVKT